MILLRIAAFVAQSFSILSIASNPNSPNIKAINCSIVCIGAGFSGLFEATLSMFTTWADLHLSASERYVETLARTEWLARTSLILVIVGGIAARPMETTPLPARHKLYRLSVDTSRRLHFPCPHSRLVNRLDLWHPRIWTHGDDHVYWGRSPLFNLHIIYSVVRAFD